jgi:hypothetical protein
MNPGYQIKPNLEEIFKTVQVKEIIHEVLTDVLLGMENL